MPSIGQTWVLASIGAVVEMGVLSTLKLLLMESSLTPGASKSQEPIDDFCSLQEIEPYCFDPTDESISAACKTYSLTIKFLLL
jgi:hypothetical protein